MLFARLALIVSLAGTSLHAQCETLSSYRVLGSLPTGLQPAGTASEVSGVVASRSNPDILWVHDDKGNDTQLIAIRTNGQLAQQYRLTSASNTDWEDIASGPGPVEGLAYLYIADAGDNTASRSDSVLWRVPEPRVPDTPAATQGLSIVEAFRFRFPGGSRDTEACFVDPLDGTPYFVSKELGRNGRLWRYPMPLDAAVTKTLVLAASFFADDASFSGADISPDGRMIVLRSRDRLHWYRRSIGQSVAQSFLGVPCRATTGNQGNVEAMCFDAEARNLIAIPEGSGAALLEAQIRFGTARLGNPTSFAFGSAWRGLFSTPELASTSPILGKSPLVFSGYSFLPNAPAIFLLSPTRLDDGRIRLGSGWLHALPDIVLPNTANGLGRLRLDFGVIPDLSGLRGLSLYAQIISPDRFTAGGFSMTRGLAIYFAR